MGKYRCPLCGEDYSSVTCPTVASLSENALSQVGKPMTWDRLEPTRRHVEGICTAAKPSFSTITNERGSFHGVRFLIKPNDGSRSVWTDTFADEPRTNA